MPPVKVITIKMRYKVKRIVLVLALISIVLLTQNVFFIPKGYCSYPVESDYYEDVEESEEESDESEEERKEREELEEAINESTDREEDYPSYY